MLIEFSVQNFRSIKDMQTLSMVAAPIKSKKSQLDKDNIIPVTDKMSLLKSAAIYGANGSGKSNLITAMAGMLGVIKVSMINENALNLFGQPFIFSRQSATSPIYFQIQFILDQKKYRYGFEFNKDRILSEWLFGTAEKNEVYYFKRELDEIEINENQFNEGKGLIDKTSAKNLFLNVVNAFNGAISQGIKKYLTHNVFVGQELENEEGIMKKRSLTFKWMDIKNGKKQILSLLNFADMGIERIWKESINGQDRIFLEKAIYNEEGKKSGQQMIPLISESKGTQKFFNEIGLIMFAFSAGLVLFLDEFESNIHPLLAKKIVQMFNSPKINKKGAQLIFATHDTNLLDADLLRRDQIYFTEKNKKNETELYSLYDIKGVRNDASYEKDYIKGKYGAIPFLGDFETLFEESV